MIYLFIFYNTIFVSKLKKIIFNNKKAFIIF